MCSDRNVLNFLYKTIKYKIEDKSQQNNKWWYCLENFRVGDIISYPLLPYITNSPNLLMERIFILGFFAKVALHHLFPWHKCLKISLLKNFIWSKQLDFTFSSCWKDLLKIGANKGFWKDWHSYNTQPHQIHPFPCLIILLTFIYDIYWQLT